MPPQSDLTGPSEPLTEDDLAGIPMTPASHNLHIVGSNPDHLDAPNVAHVAASYDRVRERYTVRFTDPESRLRPQHLKDVIGQKSTVNHLRTAISATVARGDMLDHVFLSGPAGLGKTTIAGVIASELDCVLIRHTGMTFSMDQLNLLTSKLINSGTAAGEGKDFDRYVLFIDEIHMLEKSVMTAMLPLIEDFRWGDIDCPPFTLVGATTDPSKLTFPFRERFGISYALTPYGETEISMIIHTALNAFKTGADAEAIASLARRSRGNPRQAIKLTKRSIDYIPTLPDLPGSARVVPSLTTHIVSQAMEAMGIDTHGLTDLDRRVLVTMMTRYSTRPVGLRPLASACGESEDTIEEIVEPELVRRGFVNREQRGRVLTPEGNRIAAMAFAETTEF